MTTARPPVAALWGHMKTIAYCSPFVPVEWIAAHGLRPRWVRMRSASPHLAVTRGTCPYAGAVIDGVLSGIEADAIVLTTICDQMRYAAAVLQSRHACPIFLMNVPSTWQTAPARNLYLDELMRLGRFLVQMGGSSPSAADLSEIMMAYDRARASLLAARDRLSAREFAQAAAEVRGPLSDISDLPTGEPRANGIGLAVLGGPLLESDYSLLSVIEQAGARVALDATEGGQRTLPRPFDQEQISADSMRELSDAYFGAIPDAFRRPDSGLFEWLDRELSARQVSGIIFHRYVWCDLWHALLARVKQHSSLPVLEMDAGSPTVPGLEASNRTQGRIEAFLEMLR